MDLQNFLDAIEFIAMVEINQSDNVKVGPPYTIYSQYYFFLFVMLFFRKL